MLLLLVSWLILYFITSISGYALLQTTCPVPTNRVSQTEVVLAGLAVVVVITQLVSIGWPTDHRVSGLLLLAAIAVNWRLANQPVQKAVGVLRRITGQPLIWVLVGTVLIFSIGKPAYFDSGMYHIPAIHWYERFRVIPGLGNLHGRLAFNSSYFLASAAFGFTALAGQTLYALNGFVLIVFGTYIIHRIGKPAPLPGLGALQVLVLGLALYYLLYPISAPSPDIWATLLPVFVFLFWLDQTPETSPIRGFMIVLLGLLCVTVKLGTVPLLLFLPLLLVSHWRSLTFRQGLLLVALGGIVVGPWLVRNVILSGYLIYPFQALDLFSVDWKMPVATVRLEDNFVVFWSRFHVGEGEKGFDLAKLTWSPVRWLPIWWHDQGNPQTIHYYKLNLPLFVLACLSPLVAGFQVLRAGLHPRRLWLAYGVALAGFLFWFIKAPEFRFGLAFIWMAALLPWLPLLGRLPLAENGRLVVGALGLFMVFSAARMIYQKRPVTARSLVFPIWYGYREAQETEGARYRPRTTRSGLVVLIPEADKFEQRCFELDQPCSPYFFDDLRKRGTSLDAGFRRR